MNALVRRIAATVVACCAAVAVCAAPAVAAGPITISNGLFVNVSQISWSAAPTTTLGDRTVTLTTTGFAGVTATGPTGSVFHTTLGSTRYMFIGTANHLLLLETSKGVGPVTRSVSLVDFGTTPPTERPILSLLTSSSAVPPPAVQFSTGTGDAFFIFGSTGTTTAGLGIYRGDNGAILCPGPPPLVPSGQLVGEATATQLRIKMGGTVLAACARPAGTGA